MILQCSVVTVAVQLRALHKAAAAYGRTSSLGPKISIPGQAARWGTMSLVAVLRTTDYCSVMLCNKTTTRATLPPAGAIINAQDQYVLLAGRR